MSELTLFLKGSKLFGRTSHSPPHSVVQLVVICGEK